MDRETRRELDLLWEAVKRGDRGDEKQWDAIEELRDRAGARPANGTGWKVVGAVATVLTALGFFLGPIIAALTAHP